VERRGGAVPAVTPPALGAAEAPGGAVGEMLAARAEVEAKADWCGCIGVEGAAQPLQMYEQSLSHHVSVFGPK
jgi:hypothetical protein